MAASKSLTPAERKLRAQLAAYTRWATADDTAVAEQNRKMMQGQLDRFAREVDPDGKLSPAERERRARAARAAHMAKLSLKASRTRKAKGGTADAA